jgi:hypothetical protein
MIQPFYVELGNVFKSYLYGVKNQNGTMIDHNEEKLNELIDLLPHGSGIDGTTKLDLEHSKLNKIIITSSYHHMDEYGGYDGWTDFEIILSPDWGGFDIDIKGKFPKRYLDTKEYLADTFATFLNLNLKCEYQKPYKLIYE